MKHLFAILTFIIISSLLLSNCGGKRVEPVSQINKPHSVSVNGEVPDWFLNPPQDPNCLYATATAVSRDLQHAVSAANEGARLEIARQMRMKISGMLKRFNEEIGIGEDSELLSTEMEVSKSVASEILIGCKPGRQKIVKEGILYRAYILMEMPLGAANEVLLSKIKDNKWMYTQFRASQAFLELEKEVLEHEQPKKEQDTQ